MKKNPKLIGAVLLISVGVVLAHVSVWLSSFPHHQHDTLAQTIAADAFALGFSGYLLGSYVVIV